MGRDRDHGIDETAPRLGLAQVLGRPDLDQGPSVGGQAPVAQGRREVVEPDRPRFERQGQILQAGGQAAEPGGFEGGEPLILLAIACWSWYSVTAQHAMPHCSQIQLTAATAIPAGVLLLATYGLLLAMGLVGAPPAAPSAGDLLLIIWLSVSTVVIGVLAWNIGVKRLGVVVASMFLNLIPVAGVLTAAALGSPPTLEQVRGGLLIIAGVLQAQLRGLARARAARRRDGTPGA